MEDELKNIFQNNSASLDEDVPQGHVDRFIGKLDANKKNSQVWNVMKLAASVLLLIGIGFGIARSVGDSAGEDVLVSTSNQSAVVTDNMEVYFTKKMDSKMSEFERLGVLDTAITNQSIREMERLEDAYLILKVKLKKYDNNKRIIKAMANNYRARLKLLEVLINRLEHNLREEASPGDNSIKRKTINTI